MTEQEKVRRLAVELMGWEEQKQITGCYEVYLDDAGRPHYARNDILPGLEWRPYHRIQPAWLLVRKLRKKGWQFTLFDWGIPNAAGLIWTASFAKLREDNRPGYDGGGATEMEAICEAALAVLDVGA